MFTGIVEELGTVVAVEPRPDGARLTISAPVVAADAGHGDSIAVNGVCLTAVEVTNGQFTADVVRETLSRSALHRVTAGDGVNLERAMALGDRLGGHIVQGHVDGTGVVRAVEEDGLTRFQLPRRLAPYLVDKGSITVDGVSLTLVEAGVEEFGVALIPTTKELTTLGSRRVGDEVNLEVDVLAKHLEKLAAPHLDALARSRAAAGDSASTGEGTGGGGSAGAGETRLPRDIRAAPEDNGREEAR